MQFLLSVLDDGTGVTTAEHEAATDAFNRRLIDDGRRVFAGGMGAPLDAVVVDARGDAAVTTSGSWSSAAEHVAGIWILEADDRATAERLAAGGSAACNRRIEVRAFL